jgi:hypothetical protein
VARFADAGACGPCGAAYDAGRATDADAGDGGGPVATPSAAPSDPGLTAAQQRAMVGRARPRVARCLAICQEQNRCPETLHGAVSLSVDPDGTTTVSRLDPSLEGARRCLEGEARFLHFPGQAQPYVLALPVGAGP